jgi:PAS domain S-box-containing protein
VSHAELLNYVLGRKKLSSRSGMSAAQAIVHNSTDGIVLASAQGMIDYVNPALSEILRLSPEDLLGQRLATLFAEAHRTEIDAQLRLLQDHQSSSDLFEGEARCLRGEDAEAVLCSVCILALSGDDRQVTDLVLIVRDITDAHEQQIASQAAKAASEALLFAILPRSIVARIDAGATDVTFVVPLASVMFIDIIKFSEFSKALTPQQILGTLAAIFGSFDERLAKWPMITKIKLIGDVYMCAAGLFDDASPPAAAEEIVLYAQECLDCLEDQNVKMDVTLSVRIGINTGGPIIAGLLGTENRVFDIIGDAINVAARLQSTSLPNTVQMAAQTMEFVMALNLPLRRRDNVILKGKDGAVSTFLLKREGSLAI